jgi:hypothetical protein
MFSGRLHLAADSRTISSALADLHDNPTVVDHSHPTVVDHLQQECRISDPGLRENESSKAKSLKTQKVTQPEEMMP